MRGSLLKKLLAPITALVALCGLQQHAVAQLDVSQVDIQVIPDGSGNLEVQLRPNADLSQADGLISVTFTLGWPTTSGGSTGAPDQFTGFSAPFCAFQGALLGESPDGEIDNGGTRHQTYNCISTNALPVSCSFPANTWFKYAIIPMTGIGCGTLNVVNDTYTGTNNKNFYVSLGGPNVTGTIVGTGVTTGNPPTTANAGPDQTVCGTSATLAGNTPSVGTGAWSIISGAGGSVATPSSPTSNFTGVAGTTYTLRWTISNAPCTASTDDVVITLTANPTTANAGPDQTVCGSSATLAANTATVGTGSWSIISGTGGTVTTTSSPTSGFTGVAGTIYTLRWTISNSPCTASTDDVVITLVANPTTANAGADQNNCSGGFTLAANTPSVGTGAWSVVSTPVGGSLLTAQFSNVNSPSATFTPSPAPTGAYTLRWTISNGICTSSSDDVVVTRNAAPTTANAGTDQTICTSPGSTTMAANTATSGTGTWTQTAGPASANIVSPNSPTTQITGMTVAGTYTFIWTIATAGCGSSADAVDVDAGATSIWYADADGDGAGDPAVTQSSCTPPPGYVSNSNDQCPADGNKIAPGQCGCGVADTDTDGDGTANCNDGCPNDPLKTSPGQCGCGVADTDSDGDGTANCNDGCPNDPNKIAPGVCGCGVADTDSDGDGTPNCNDGCPNDPNKTSPGICGCGVADTDSDSDGTPNCNDGCPSDPNKIAPGICGCGVADTDTDGDLTADCNDGCPNDANKTSPGTCGCGNPEPGTPCDDGNSGTTGDVIGTNCLCAGSTVPCPDDGNPCTLEQVIGGVCEHTPLPDTDGDGACDLIDGCVNDPNKTSPGECGCGIPDTDGDGDGVANCNDGCPTDPNKTAPGICGCGVPDTDSDGDLTADCNDGCPNDPLKTAPGACGCGVADTDTDGDLTADCNDGCVNDPNKTAPGQCGCGVADTDTDGDLTADCNDGCVNDPNKTDPGVCGCGTPDVDSDGDLTLDCNDGCPNDPLKTAPGACGCGVADTDTDGDLIADCSDNCPNVPGQQGSPCDDLDPLTFGDVLDANCECHGSTVNCDDGDPCTADSYDGIACQHDPLPDTDGDGTCDLIDGCVNDPLKIAPGICGCGVPDTDTDGDLTPDCNDDCPLDPNKTSPGICGCGIADTDSDGDGTANCNDGCPNDPLKTAPGICGCGVADSDTDSDGTADCNDGCPNDPNKVAPGNCGCGNLEPGATCDDLDVNTTGDVIGSDCICAGTPTGCTEILFLDITLDNFGSQNHVELRDETGTIVLDQSGPYPDGLAGTTVSDQFCVPVGCYKLYVIDSGLDGIANGGYVLKDASGRRLLDANGLFAGQSAAQHAFCVPTTNLGLITGSCDRTNWTPNSVVYCNTTPGATGYQFHWFDPHGSYSRYILLSSPNMKPKVVITNPIPLGLDLNVRVRAVVGGSFTEWGRVCRARVNPDPGSSLVDEAGYHFLVDEQAGIRMNLYPNPNRDGLVFVMVDGLDIDDATSLSIDVYDMFGKHVRAERFPVDGEEFNYAMELGAELESGMYLFNVTVGEKVFTQRLVKQ